MRPIDVQRVGHDAVVRAELPRGYLTFLFSDVEGSTRLLRTLGEERVRRALRRHRDLVRCGMQGERRRRGGHPGGRVLPLVQVRRRRACRRLRDRRCPRRWPARGSDRIHSGTALVTEDGYVGNDVHVAARIAAAGSGGQILVSEATANELTREAAAPPFTLRGLGGHRLKDVDEPVVLFQLGDRSFPPLRTVGNSNLPSPLSTFVGRQRELAAVLATLADGARLLSVTGPGGAGKTRLALAAARASVPGYPGGVFWVDLADVHDPGRLREAIAQSIGARGELAAEIGFRQMLIVLDNFEHIAAAAVELPQAPGLVSEPDAPGHDQRDAARSGRSSSSRRLHSLPPRRSSSSACARGSSPRTTSPSSAHASIRCPWRSSLPPPARRS